MQLSFYLANESGNREHTVHSPRAFQIYRISPLRPSSVPSPESQMPCGNCTVDPTLAAEERSDRSQVASSTMFELVIALEVSDDFRAHYGGKEGNGSDG